MQSICTSSASLKPSLISTNKYSKYCRVSNVSFMIWSGYRSNSMESLKIFKVIPPIKARCFAPYGSALIVMEYSWELMYYITKLCGTYRKIQLLIKHTTSTYTYILKIKNSHYDKRQEVLPKMNYVKLYSLKIIQIISFEFIVYKY